VNVVYKVVVNHEEPTPRRRRRRANLDRIVEAATQVVFEEGVEALSVKRVADLADYTPGALYRYFPSKDALLAAVVVGSLDGLAVELAAVEGPPLACIVGAARVYHAFSRREPHAFALITSMVGDPRVLMDDDVNAALVMEAMVRALTPLVVALDRATQTGVLQPGDARERTLVLFASLQGALMLRKQERRAPGLIDSDRLFFATLRALLAGFGADPNALDLLDL
jgi:AcrR family transcriptional regulator